VKRGLRRSLWFLVSLVLLVTSVGGAWAADLSIVWKPYVTGKLTPETGISISQNKLVPMAQADVLMQGQMLVTMNGAEIRRVEGTSFDTLRKLPTDGYSDEARIVMDGVYAIRDAGGTYAKLCMCGTYLMGLSDQAYYTEYGMTLAVAMQASSGSTTGGSTPSAPPAPAPVGDRSTLTATASADGKVTLSWTPVKDPGMGYVLYRSSIIGSNGLPLNDFPTTSTSLVDTQAIPGFTYNYQVTTLKREGYVPVSDPVTVTAGTVEGWSLELLIGQNQIGVNGRMVSVGGAPYLVGNVPMVLLRPVTQLLGIPVDFDSTKQTVRMLVGEQVFGIQVGVATITLNDQPAGTLPATPKVTADGRVEVPAALFEYLGAMVDYSAEKGLVTIMRRAIPASPTPSGPVNGDKDRAAEYFKQADQLVGEGKMEAALEALNAALTLDDTEPWYWYARGLIRHNLGQVEAAAADYRHVMEMDAAKTIMVPVDGGSATAPMNEAAQIALDNLPQSSKPQPKPEPPAAPKGSFAGEWQCMSFAGGFCPVGWNLTIKADGTYKSGVAGEQSTNGGTWSVDSQGKINLAGWFAFAGPGELSANGGNLTFYYQGMYIYYARR